MKDAATLLCAFGNHVRGNDEEAGVGAGGGCVPAAVQARCRRNDPRHHRRAGVSPLPCFVCVPRMPHRCIRPAASSREQGADAVKLAEHLCRAPAAPPLRSSRATSALSQLLPALLRRSAFRCSRASVALRRGRWARASSHWAWLPWVSAAPFSPAGRQVLQLSACDTPGGHAPDEPLPSDCAHQIYSQSHRWLIVCGLGRERW